MNYRLTHTSTYEYAEPVSIAHHLARITPRALPHQTCRRCDITVAPSPQTISQRNDYFGNLATFVIVQELHQKLVVKAESEVELSPPPSPDPAATPAWEKIRDAIQSPSDDQSLRASQFAFDSPYVRANAQLADYARPSFPAARPLFEAVLDLTRRINEHFTFDPKATTVATPLATVLAQRRGVCQDFAHLETGCLRSLGLAARYVSGYLETVPPPNQPRLAGADASHAWVSVYCPTIGWFDVDPTNNLAPANRHVTVAWGRDYGDVSPTRGVILGGGAHTLRVAVDVVALA